MCYKRLQQTFWTDTEGYECWESHEKSSLWFHIFLETANGRKINGSDFGTGHDSSSSFLSYRNWRLSMESGEISLKLPHAPPQKISLVQRTRRNLYEACRKFTYQRIPSQPFSDVSCRRSLRREPRNESHVACNRFQNFPRDMFQFQRSSTSCRVASLQPFKLYSLSLLTLLFLFSQLSLNNTSYQLK